MFIYVVVFLPFSINAGAGLLSYEKISRSTETALNHIWNNVVMPLTTVVDTVWINTLRMSISQWFIWLKTHFNFSWEKIKKRDNFSYHCCSCHWALPQLAPPALPSLSPSTSLPSSLLLLHLLPVPLAGLQPQAPTRKHSLHLLLHPARRRWCSRTVGCCPRRRGACGCRNGHAPRSLSCCSMTYCNRKCCSRRCCSRMCRRTRSHFHLEVFVCFVHQLFYLLQLLRY